MEILNGYIRSIACFMIFSAFVGLVLPNKKYTGYIQLLLGVILILIVFKPLRQVRDWSQAPEFRGFPALEQESGQADLQAYSAARDQLILDVYTSRLADQISLLVESTTDSKPVDVQVEADPDTGAPVSIALTVPSEPPEPDMAAGRPFIRIEEVDLRRLNPEQEEADELGLSLLEKENIKNILSDFYNLSVDNIHIKVQKK